MSEAKHTPLPWGIEYVETGVRWPVIVAPDAMRFDDGSPLKVCELSGCFSLEAAPGDSDRIVVEANAEFIVRACNCHDELLAACNEAQVALGDLADFYVGRQDHNPSFAAGIKSVRRAVHAAIAKAEATDLP